MAIYGFTKTDSVQLADVKQQYLARLATPIVCDSELIGHCVVNENKKLLQFSVADMRNSLEIFKQALNELDITGAFVATCECQFLSLCMDQQKSVVVNALMYHIENEASLKNATFPPSSHFRIIDANELQIATDFGIEVLNADPTWLNGYFSERIEKEELFGLWQENTLIATGECRPSHTQVPHADLGMVVSKRYRGQGIATSILRQLLLQCRERGLMAICSTESDNIAAQQAITNSGFVSHHRILEIEL